jgi:hypothetical protein
LSEATDARWGTTTQQQYGFSASEDTARTHSVTAEYGGNLGNQVGEAALRKTDGSPDAALRNAVRDPDWARALAKDVVEGTELPKEVFGGEIREPQSVDAMHEDGLGKVNEANLKNIPSAREAGHEAMGQAREMQGRLVGASANSGPSLEPASAGMEENKAKIEGLSGFYAENRQVEAGVTRVTERMFFDKGGMRRIANNNLTAGLLPGTESPKQIRDELKMFANTDPEVKSRIISIAKQGQATDADMEFLKGKLWENDPAPLRYLKQFMN